MTDMTELNTVTAALDRNPVTPLGAPTGFLHPRYAASHAERGEPRQLTRSGAWIIQRAIPGSRKMDAMGVYPLVLCQDWSGLAADLDELRGDVVCVGLVPDPFGHVDEAYLRRCFPDLVLPFKDHLVADLRRPRDEIASPHHRRKALKASRTVRVEVCSDPVALAHDWIELYEVLMRRHDIRGVAAFSPRALTTQLAVPGLVMLRAVHGETTVGAATWYVTGNIAYGHLAAYSDLGYALSASYAVFWRAIEYFAWLGLQYLHLGAGPGIGEATTDGLSVFKRGWATETRQAYFCGRIFDLAAYRGLCASTGATPEGYFPAYRRGEFA